MCSDDAKILLISGTHGSKDGKSALTEASLNCHCFYREDCKQFAIQPGPSRVAISLPIKESDWQYLPDITKPAERIKNPATAAEGVCTDEEMVGMDIRVLNMTYYHKQGEKLKTDIEQESSDDNMMEYNELIFSVQTGTDTPGFLLQPE